MRRYFAVGIFLAALLVGSIFYFRSQIPSDFVSTDAAKTKGALTSSITIIEYSNFTCGACRTIRPQIAGILKKYEGKVKLVFRHFPQFGNQTSLWAHVAAECAAQKGVFWDYHNKLFDHQIEWSISPEPLPYFIHYPKELGLDPKQFSDCLKDPKTLERVKEEDKSGRELSIKVTPSFFIEGEAFVGAQQFVEGASGKIESALKKRGLLP